MLDWIDQPTCFVNYDFSFQYFSGFLTSNWHTTKACIFLAAALIGSTTKYFYHKQIRKSEIIFLFFLAKDVVDNLLNSIHSYVGKNYAYTVIDLCRWFNAVRIGSNDAIKFLLVTSRLNMKYELLVTTVIVIRSFHENTWRIHHIISGLMHPEKFSNFELCMQLLFI